MRLRKDGSDMKHELRARVASVVAAATSGANVNSVYDYSKNVHRQASVQINMGQISGYDYDTSTHFSGGGNGVLDFYDYETSKHVQLKLNGNQFSGYDYNSSSHFSGTANNRSITLYDYETSQHYNFSA